MLRILISRLPPRQYKLKTRRSSLFKSCKPVRCYSKNICPPPPKKGSQSSGTLYTLGALALVGGATIGYAKYNPDFRRTLVTYVPFVDDVVRVVFQEESSLLGSISEAYESLKGAIGNAFKEDKRRIVIPPISDLYKAPPPVISGLEDTTKPIDPYTEIRVDNNDGNDCEIAGEVKKDPGEGLSEYHPSNLAELEEKICSAATESVNAYNKAVFDLKTYNKEIDIMLDQALDNISESTWDSIREKTRTKNQSIKTAQQKAEEAAQDVTKLKQLLSNPEFEASAATREMANINIQKVQDDIAKAKKEFTVEQRMGSITEKYWDKVQKARHHFSQELEILFPTIDLNNKRLDVNESELDLFLLYAYNHVLFYQKELARIETISKGRLLDAVEHAKETGGQTLSTAQICEAVDGEKRQLSLALQHQCLKLRNEAEQDLREQLRRQSQVFTDHLDEVVKTRSLEIERNLNRKFDEQLEGETVEYKKKLAGMLGRLKGLDQALRSRDASDKASKQSQVLWSACQALLRAITTGCPGIPWQDQLRPLNPEIALVNKAAAKGDELVAAVINGIPSEAKNRGVFPQDALRERFLKVEQVARTVALLPEEGAALPLHILSYIQSLFLINNPSPIPQAELNDEKVDFSNLSTHEILQRARYWLDRGNFSQTLKYMNLLEGAPRSVSRQWMNETRIFLETQQAADTLMAHAASSGLLYL